MLKKSLELEGLALITPKLFGDDRGFFTERFRADLWSTILPGHPGFFQDNYSWSAPGVLRGLHFQNDPAQGKLVTCVSGSIIDVAVDVRPGSPTLGRHVQVQLNAKEPQWLWLPAGFAHGFLVTSPEGAGVMYKVDAPYSPSTERAIRWNDSDLKIACGMNSPKMSAKDQAAPSFRKYMRSVGQNL